MDLKKTLKNIKLNESLISMLLGLFVIALVGFLVINYFRGLGKGDITMVGEEDTTLPTTHIVENGEDLWSIANKYYGSGYNWVDIAEENDIDNPNMLTVGEEITIPDVEPIVLGDETENIAQAEITPTPTVIPTATPTLTPTPAETRMEVNQNIDKPNSETSEPIRGNSYTVIRGDNLWDIAVRAYGDGFRWKEIAEANDLVNPSIIHRGNVFIIPR